MSAIRELFSHAHRACLGVFVTNGSSKLGDDGSDLDNLGIENRKRSVAINERRNTFDRLSDDPVPFKTLRTWVAHAPPKSSLFSRYRRSP